MTNRLYIIGAAILVADNFTNSTASGSTSVSNTQATGIGAYGRIYPGTSSTYTIEQVTEEYWDNRLNTNLKHLFFCAQAVIPGMKAKGDWHLVRQACFAGVS